MFVTGSNPQRIETARQDLAGVAEVISSDAGSPSDIAALARRIADDGGLDVLFLNAGIAKFGAIEMMSEETFADTFRINAWDLKQPLLWAYYFEARERAPLEALAETLRERQYQVVEVLEPEGPVGSYVLHVSRAEKHSVDSLNARNRQLCALAKKLRVDRYQGMDVGPVSNGASVPPRSDE